MDQPKQKNNIPLLRACSWLFLIGMIIAFMMYFKSILVPFIFGIIVAFFVQELVVLTGKINIGGQALPDWLRRVLVLLLVVGVIFGVVEIIIANVDQIIQKAPEYEETLDDLLSQIGTLTGANGMSTDIQEQIDNIEINKAVSSVFSSFSSFLGNFFMALIYGIFLLSEQRTFPLKLDAIVSDPENRKELSDILDQIAEAVRQYLSVKTFVSLLTGGLSYIVLLLFGVDFPVLWAFLIFLFNYIPYLGSFIATLLPTLLAIFQFESLLTGLWVFLAIQSIQTVVGTFLEPRISGRTLNLSPTVVILALAVWGALWGIVGMAIAVPVTSIIVIILAEFPNTRNAAILLSEKGEVD